jgi:hypothetical protein
MDHPPIHATLGELVAAVYETLIEEYGDPELASVATTAIVQDMLSRRNPVMAREALPAA